MASWLTRVANSVPPPSTRIYTSVGYVFHFPEWFSGGQFDQIVNEGITLPAGCKILRRSGRLQCPAGNGVWEDCSNTKDEIAVAYGGGRGFTVLPAGPRSLATNVLFWHDPFNGVVVRVKYEIEEPAGLRCDLSGGII